MFNYLQGAPCGQSINTFDGHIEGYKRNDLQLCQMKGYNLTYGHFKRVPECIGKAWIAKKCII